MHADVEYIANALYLIIIALYYAVYFITKVPSSSTIVHLVSRSNFNSSQTTNIWNPKFIVVSHLIYKMCMFWVILTCKAQESTTLKRCYRTFVLKEQMQWFITEPTYYFNCNHFHLDVNLQCYKQNSLSTSVYASGQSTTCKLLVWSLKLFQEENINISFQLFPVQCNI